MRRHFLAMTVALAGVLWPLVSEGAILTYVTQGRVTQITDPLGLLDFVHLGDVVTYRATFDTTRSGVNPFPGYSGYYAEAASVIIGSTIFAASNATMAISHPMDLVSLDLPLSISLPGLQPNATAIFRLNDQSESNALTETSLPTVPYDLGLFASKGHQITFYAPSDPPGSSATPLWFVATVDSFIIVPEPSMCFLLFAGGLLLVHKRFQ